MNDTENPDDVRAISTLLELTGRQLNYKGPRLVFEKRLETVFQEETARARNRQTIVASFFALIVLNSFLILDYMHRYEIFGTAVFMRVVVATLPCLLVLAWLMRLPPAWLRNGLMSAAVVIVALSSNILLTYSTTQMAHYNAFSFGLIVIAGNIVLQIRFPFAVATSIICCAMTAIFLSQMSILNTEEKVLPVFYMSAMAALTLIANYRLEKASRHSYLLMLREKLQSHEVRDLNQRLSTFSYTDPLTGIANRRRFDEAFDETWHAARRSGIALSLLIIDVDYFKSYNDVFGHPAGDHCLRQIARAIESETRKTGDLPARLGGEEFAVLLRDMDAMQACKVATRIHGAVQQLALPHNRPDGGDHVTVSIGLASSISTDDLTPQALINRADTALYEAKRGGRNRTFHASDAA